MAARGVVLEAVELGSLVLFDVDMKLSGPVDLGAGQVEGDVEGTHVLSPLQRSAEVDVAILIWLTQGGCKLQVVWVEGLAQVGSEGDDCG